MAEVNREKVITLITEVQKARKQLESYVSLPAEIVLGSPEKLNSVKYLFVIGIEACIDICQHISAKLFQEVPESCSSCFDVLNKKGVISQSLCERMAHLAQFRNVLVHLYWKVDDRRVLDHLTQIETLDEFTKVIAKYLDLSR